MTDHCLHSKFDEQASIFAEQTVATFSGRTLTYGELKQQSDFVAQNLIASGVQPGDRVALNISRSLQLLPGLLGTLKAGAVCVPIDPDDPVDRSVTILKHADVAVVLTEKSIRERFTRTEQRIVTIEELMGEPIGLPASLPKNLVSPDDLAFLFYTSGSTGVPKGVMLSHRALVAGQAWLSSTFPLASGDTQLFRTTISITNLIREVFWPIFAGGTIVIVPPGQHKDPDKLLKLLIEHRIRTIMVVPALLSAMCDLPTFATVRALKYVFCSSDVMPTSIADKYFATGVPGKLFNLYGLTEALYCSFYEVSPNERFSTFVPVGVSAELTPIILDEYLEPVPDATIGELFISGVGMAKGYYKLPNLTAERFIDTPLGKLFRTGDLARLGQYGLELLGRSDNQVKIAGYRVELGELETHLDRCPGVRKSIAVGRVDAHGHKRLVAYLTSDEPSQLRSEAIRTYLEAKLPSYMIPSAFAIVDEIPLTHNGKVDRSRLEHMRGHILELTEEYVAPRTPIEALFCELWAQTLGVERVGVHENFFSLGGDSILGLLVATKAYRKGYHLASTQIFATPTIAELVAFIETHPDLHLEDTEPQSEVLVRDQQGFRPDAFSAFGWTPFDVERLTGLVMQHSAASRIVDFYPLTDLQKGMYFHSLLDPDSGVYFEQFVYDVEGPIDLELYRQSWQKVIDRHDILRCFLLLDGQLGPIQVIQNDAEAAWNVENWSEQKASFDANFERFLAEDRSRGFSYDKAPLLRLTFLKQAPNCYKMVISYHHLILDAWSLFVILNESLRIYYSIKLEEPLSLPLARSFRNYVASMYVENIKASRQYWLQVLDGFKRPTKIGCAEKLGLSASELEKHHESRLDLTKAETEELLDFGRRNQLTLNTLVQAGWALLLAVYSKKSDVCFGITITHRPIAIEGIENMVGIFINSLPIRVQIENADIVNWLHGVQKAQVSARAHDYYPLPILQQHTSVPGDEPLFESLLIFENFPRGIDWQKDNDVQVRQRRYVGWTNYPFAIEAMPEDNLFFQVKYDEAFFSAEDVEQILNDYRSLLIAIATGGLTCPTGAQTIITHRCGMGATAPSDMKPRGTICQPKERKQAQTQEECELAEIWSQILGIKDIDIATPFLRLGGDSLKGMQVLALAQEAGYEFELRELFNDSGTVAALAARFTI